MVARLILRDREYEVQEGRTILYTLIQLRVDVRVVRPMRDGELIEMQEVIRAGDTIYLVPLVSGG